jgi:hypothetical protein
MDKYINYLLADIAAACAEVPVYALSGFDYEEEDFLTLEEEVETAPRHQLATHLGMKTEWFPPAERLSEPQMQRVLTALVNAITSANFIVNFPEDLPISLRYKIMRDQLAKEVPILVQNTWQIDFCDYEPKTCVFGSEYCQCQLYERWLNRLQENEEERQNETDEDMDAHPQGGMAMQYRLPGFLFDDWVEEAGGSYYQGDELEDEEEDWDDSEDDWDEDDYEGPRFSDFRDFEPGPDDDGLWN